MLNERQSFVIVQLRKGNRLFRTGRHNVHSSNIRKCYFDNGDKGNPDRFTRVSGRTITSLIERGLITEYRTGDDGTCEFELTEQSETCEVLPVLLDES